MSYWWVEHEQYGKVLFNTATQGFVVLPESRNKIAMNGKLFDYFESLRDFQTSDKPACVMLLYCKERKEIGRRVKYTFITSFESVEFFNVEKISSGWIRHEITECFAGEAYLVYLIREADCMNVCRVARAKVAG
jgi:hypothetical protein